MVIGALYLLFPRQTLTEKLRSEPGNDQLTADYITALLRTDPANFELRILLAEKRFAMGQIAAAREAMGPVLLTHDPVVRRRVLILELRMLETENVAAKAGTPSATAIQARLRELLGALLTEDWPPQQLLALSGSARRLHAPDLARAYMRRVENSNAHIPPAWLAEAARQALGDGDYIESARLYFAAKKRATELDDQREYFLKGLATLRSGNLLREALTAADAEAGNLRNDEETLVYLTRLALAAGDPKRAQDYVKRLLHLSEEFRSSPPVRTASLAEQLLGWMMASAHAAEVATSPALRAYDEQLYTLAYDVFLANGNVADAYRVAAAAVAQRPDDVVWRRKLAQTAEWNGQPQEALQQWLLLAKRTDADDAWKAVLRLAPGLQDNETLLAAWTREAGLRQLTAPEIKRISEIYELLGRPADGIAFLNAQYQRRNDAAILETIADLQERSGRIDDAIASMERLLKAEANNPGRAVRLATLLFLRSEFARAYAVLQPLRTLAANEAVGYWKLLADLAWQLQDDTTATEAYGRLQDTGSASGPDVERLVTLLRPTHPDDARRMATFAWNRFRSLSGFMIALELNNEQRDYAAAKRLLEELRPEEEAALAGNGYYFVLRAAYFQSQGNSKQAMAEYRRALTANPDNGDLRLSYLWLLIDTRESRELRERLREWSGSPYAGIPAWWDAYAAGWLVLGEPRRALPWMSRQAAAHANDYLWLANYAETLEEAGQTGMAVRVRRHAWIQARTFQSGRDIGNTGNATQAKQRELMIAYARLALRSAPGDASFNAIRRLLRQDVPVPGNAPSDTPAPEAALDRATNELVLAWMLGEERLEAARQWMWKRFAQRVQAPAWADIALALAERDRERLAEILDDDKREWPDLARIDAARELGRIKIAQSLEHEAQERRPDSDEVHLRLATDLLASASSIIARDTLFKRGAVAGHEQSLRLQTWPLARLRLTAELGILHQHSTEAGQLAGVPGTDRTLGFSAMWLHDGQAATELTLSSRSGVAEFHPLRLTHTRPLNERLSGNVALALRDRATESVALGIAGHKDEASAALNYRLSGREYLSARVWQARFHTQQDTSLGQGRGISAEAGYRFRSEYPDFNVRLSRQIGHFEADNNTIADSAAALLPLSPGGQAAVSASFFMPQSFRLWGINAGFGTDFREQRSRALRPFMDVGRSVSSTSGSGYNWMVGAGGSALGPDHLSMYWLRSKGGGVGSAVNELGLRYQLYLD